MNTKEYAVIGLLLLIAGYSQVAYAETVEEFLAKARQANEDRSDGTSDGFRIGEDGRVCIKDCPVYAKVAGVVLDGDTNIFYTSDEVQIIRATVIVGDYTPTDGTFYVKIIHLATNKVMKDFNVILKPNGNYFVSPIAYIINGVHTPIGEYQISLSSVHRYYENTSFFILHPEMEIEDLEEPKIPYWVKEIALWYGNSDISEDEFINAIEYLIKNNIINI